MTHAISHVGIAVHDLDRASSEWCARYGIRVVHTIESEVEDVRSNILSLSGFREASTCVEPIEPVDKDDLANPIARRLAHSGDWT